MTAKFLASCLLTAAAIAQTADLPTVSVSGVVKDKGTGQPLANYNVSTTINVTSASDSPQQAANKNVTVTTDPQGRYKLSGLPAGKYRIDARSAEHFGTQIARRVTLAGQDLDGIDFNMIVDGSISGKVIDENKEPVPGVTVFLVSREYYLGSLGYFFKSTGRTDDRGQYTIQRVEAGHPYLLMADKHAQVLPPHSEAPLDPKLRRRVPMRTWYPNSPSKDGAAAVVIRSGEHREGVDIEVKKSQSFCMEGTLEGPNGPAALNFQLEPLQPSSGTSSSGGMFIATPSGKTGADGKFRICDLYPATYRLTVIDWASDRDQQPPGFAAPAITIADQDLKNLKIAVAPGLPLEGEVVLDGPTPETPIATKISVSLNPLLRAYFPGDSAFPRASIPGTLSSPGMLIDDYSVRAVVNARGLYVKDVIYAGRSVLYEPLHLGSALAGTGLRVIVGQDGATVSAQVADKKGAPVADMHVLLMPAEISSEGMLAATLVSGETDQLGQYTSRTVAPGKYLIVASGDPFDVTPESIGKLWRDRNRFQQVTLAPSAAAQVSLEPVKID